MAPLRIYQRKGDIMRPTEFPAESLVSLLRKQKIAAMPQLRAALGTHSKRTVFRKLKELPCRTSYSHRGAYHTLEDIAEFDETGLWSYQDVWFSAYGTLLSTAAAVVAAESGVTSSRNSTTFCTSGPRMRCASWCPMCV